jgi:hypothetical protein
MIPPCLITVAPAPGGTYFFHRQHYRRQTFLTDPNGRSALREAVGMLRLTYPFANEFARTRALRWLFNVIRFTTPERTQFQFIRAWPL